MKAPYKPIDCSYYDRLEAWATLGETCHIIWSDKDEVKHSVQSKIVDLQVQNHAEYLMGEERLRIRLDQLVSINGIPLPG